MDRTLAPIAGIGTGLIAASFMLRYMHWLERATRPEFRAWLFLDGTLPGLFAIGTFILVFMSVAGGLRKS